MKNKASILLKKITSISSVIAKAKSSMSINTKLSTTKACDLLMLSILKSKKILLTSLSHKIHTILGHHDNGEDNEENNNKVVVLYDAATTYASQYQSSASMAMAADEEEDNDNYLDLTHSLFDDDYDIDDVKFQAATGSIIDMMRNSKEKGKEFKLEKEIDVSS